MTLPLCLPLPCPSLQRHADHGVCAQPPEGQHRRGDHRLCGLRRAGGGGQQGRRGGRVLGAPPQGGGRLLALCGAPGGHQVGGCRLWGSFLGVSCGSVYVCLSDGRWRGMGQLGREWLLSGKGGGASGMGARCAGARDSCAGIGDQQEAACIGLAACMHGLPLPLPRRAAQHSTLLRSCLCTAPLHQPASALTPATLTLVPACLPACRARWRHATPTTSPSASNSPSAGEPGLRRSQRAGPHPCWQQLQGRCSQGQGQVSLEAFARAQGSMEEISCVRTVCGRVRGQGGGGGPAVRSAGRHRLGWLNALQVASGQAVSLLWHHTV